MGSKMSKRGSIDDRPKTGHDFENSNKLTEIKETEDREIMVGDKQYRQLKITTEITEVGGGGAVKTITTTKSIGNNEVTHTIKEKEGKIVSDETNSNLKSDEDKDKFHTDWEENWKPTLINDATPIEDKSDKESVCSAHSK